MTRRAQTRRNLCLTFPQDSDRMGTAVGPIPRRWNSVYKEEGEVPTSQSYR